LIFIINIQGARNRIHVAQTSGTPALLQKLCGIQSENNNDGKDGDDRDDNQKLDEGKASAG
jgi:hypothetical protein